MFLTKRQKQILDLQMYPSSRKILSVQNNMSVSHMHTTNTVVYKDIKEALVVLDSYYELFERRLIRDKDEMKDLLLKVNRKINKSSGGK